MATSGRGFLKPGLISQTWPWADSLCRTLCTFEIHIHLRSSIQQTDITTQPSFQTVAPRMCLLLPIRYGLVHWLSPHVCSRFISRLVPLFSTSQNACPETGYTDHSEHYHMPYTLRLYLHVRTLHSRWCCKKKQPKKSCPRPAMSRSDAC